MKILQQNRSFFFGNAPFGAKDMDVRERIAQKKSLYQKEAKRVVSTADRGERRIDKAINEHREQFRHLMKENERLLSACQEYSQKMDQAKAYYEIEDDSQEEKDLELLKKAHDDIASLTEEEQNRYDQIKDHLTDYQKFSMDCYKVYAGHKKAFDDNRKQLIVESAKVRIFGIERLKEHAMTDAVAAKEEMLESASREWKGMLTDAALDQLDETTESIRQDAAEREEKKEEAEERTEAAKDKATEAQAIAEEIHAKVEEMSEKVTNSDQIMQDVRQMALNVLQAQKLLEEELKGLIINLDT